MSDSHIFNAAAKLPPDQRAEFLRIACGSDDALRQDIESLLAAHDGHSGFLAEPPDRNFDFVNDIDLDSIGPSKQIGPYKLLQQIGEGGFGVVYMAEQSSPIQRKVALKIIKPGMGTGEIIARFEAERQALALMDHPNIATVLDAGTTAEPKSPGTAATEGPTEFVGSPYFVMELVRGIPITTFCDERKLQTAERLRLFVDICRAVQHAHQKGIIHRDLKPSNVLVTLDDGRPVVKVIDFGISKALSQRLTDKTLFTTFGQMLGTPLYMSPEQAQLSMRDVDTRSDVYSLGVLLYELLTGATPFEKEALLDSGVDEMRRILLEVEPPRPSYRVSTLQTGLLTTVSGSRRIEPRKLSQSLSGELDWIVMKALEKDRNRRYESASAFAADVERFIANEPVVAGPPSRTYRARKFVARNKGFIFAASFVCLALIAGLSLATWQMFRALNAEKLAADRLEKANIATANERDARNRADNEKLKALEKSRHNRRLLFAGDMHLASRAWRRNDITRMRELLSRHIPRRGEEDLRGFVWHYLWKQVEIKPRVLAQSKAPVYSASISPDGFRTAVAGADGLIRLFYHRTAFRKAEQFNSGHGEVNGLAFSPDSKYLASAGDDGCIVIWQLPTLRRVHTLQAFPSHAYQIAFSRDGKSILACGKSRLVKVFDTKTGKELKTRFNGENRSRLECLALASNGNIAFGARDGQGEVWTSVEQKLLHRLPNRHEGAIAAIGFSRDSRLLATGQVGGLLSIYSYWSELSASRQNLPDGIQSLAFTSRTPEIGDLLAVGDHSGNIHLVPVDLHNARSGSTPTGIHLLRSRQWKAHNGKVYGLAWSKIGDQLVSVGEDGKVLLWNLDKSPVHNAISEWGHRLADDAVFVSNGSAIELKGGRLSPLPNGKDAEIPQFKSDGATLRPLRYCAKTRELFAISHQKRIVAWDASGRFLGTVWEPEDRADLFHFTVSPTGQRLAVQVRVGDQLYLQSIDRPSGTLRHRVPCNHISTLEYSPDGDFLAFNHGKEIRILEASTGRLCKTLKGHSTSINSVAFSKDGTRLVSASEDRSMKLWNWKLESCEWSVIAHRNAATSVAFLPDDRTIVSAGKDGMLKFWRWRIQTMHAELSLQAYAKEPWVRVAPDGRRIIVGNALQLYDAR